jgi:rhamnosyltransferase
MPKISIIIPVKNGMDTLPKAIEGIQKQTLFSECELVVVDSGSTDGSVSFLEQFPFVRVIPIDPKSFNHGATRNLGVQNAEGEFIAMTVQDAVPSDAFWLENMLRHFKDFEVAGVCGQQIVPHDADKNPHEWFRPQSNPIIKIVQFKKKVDFEGLTPKEKRTACGWDDVNAMYRKSVLEQLPFETVAFGEDMLWAKAALERGHKLIYDYAVRVNHYHYQFPEYTYKRVLITNVFIYKCFGLVRSRLYGLKEYALIVYRNIKWGLHPKWIWHNFEILSNHNKATKTLLKALENNTLPELEQSLALNVPLGKQNTTTK